MLSLWLGLQLVLGVALVVVPVVVSESISLVVTVPVYLAILVLTLAREAVQTKRQQKAKVLRILSTITSDLSDLTQGGGGGRHWAILQDLRGNAQFRAQMELSGNQQAGGLLDDRCRRLFTDVTNLANRLRAMNVSVISKEVNDAVTSFGQLLVEYRAVVQEFLQFLDDTKGEKETIQHTALFSTRIHRELADSYDRLMDTIRQVREELRSYAYSAWLPDDHLRRFPRAALYA